MTGPHDSVIGVKTALATHRMRTGMPVRFEVADGRRPDRGGARRVRRRERPGDARSGRFEFPGPDPACRPGRRGRRRRRRARGRARARATRRWDRTASRAPSSRSGTTARVSAHATTSSAIAAMPLRSLDEHHDREQPDQELGRDDLAERHEGDDRSGRVADEPRVALDVAAGVAHPDEQRAPRRRRSSSRPRRPRRRSRSGSASPTPTPSRAACRARGGARAARPSPRLSICSGRPSWRQTLRTTPSGARIANGR